MKVTKHKDPAGGWRIHFGGQPTEFTIVKGDPPKYREPQAYYVLDAEDWVFEARSVSSAMLIMMKIIAAIYKAEADKARGR